MFAGQSSSAGLAAEYGSCGVRKMCWPQCVDEICFLWHRLVVCFCDTGLWFAFVSQGSRFAFVTQGLVPFLLELKLMGPSPASLRVAQPSRLCGSCLLVYLLPIFSNQSSPPHCVWHSRLGCAFLPFGFSSSAARGPYRSERFCPGGSPCLQAGELAL